MTSTKKILLLPFLLIAGLCLQAQDIQSLRDNSSTATDKPIKSSTDTIDFEVDDSNIGNLNLRAYQLQELNGVYDFQKIEKQIDNSIVPKDSVTIDPAELARVQSLKEQEEAQKLKSLESMTKSYRRSSIYTLMVEDNDRPFNKVIRDAFGNAILSEKFNNHNVGPYIIPGKDRDKEQKVTIDKFLNEKQVAKMLVAKWFQRNEKGHFNMSLIAERGLYNASDLDIKLASGSQRGLAILADAGEELIGNTFVIVNDYKFTNKEEVAEKVNRWTDLIATVAVLTDNENLEKTANTVGTVSTIVGKGYIIKTTSYLYRLNWNDDIANTFYNKYWSDENYNNEEGVKAFLESELFSLRYVGMQSATADVQSTVFTNKSNADLIKIATIKATDKAYAKLAKTYAEFRTMTPLYSLRPLSAKIGTKEGLYRNQKFEVLEQVLDANGKTYYRRKAIIKARNIWNNSYLAEEEGATTNPYQQISTFVGKTKGLYLGMLIRQIN